MNAAWDAPVGGFVAWVRSAYPDAWEGSEAPPKLLVTQQQLRSAPHVARLGYQIASGEWSAADLWPSARERLTSREIPADRECFFFRPLELLGVALGVAAMREEDPEGPAGLLGVFEAARLQPDSGSLRQILFQRFALQLVSGRDDPHDLRSVEPAGLVEQALWSLIQARRTGRPLTEALHSGIEVSLPAALRDGLFVGDAADAAAIVVVMDAVCRGAAHGLVLGRGVQSVHIYTEVNAQVAQVNQSTEGSIQLDARGGRS